MLDGATITYNAIKPIVSIMAGTRLLSTARIGFGVSSVVECARRLPSRGSSALLTRNSARSAPRVVAFSVFALAVLYGQLST